MCSHVFRSIIASSIAVSCLAQQCIAAPAFRERLSRHPTWAFVASQLSPAGKAILDRLLQSADSTGRPPPLADFISILLENKVRLSRDDDTNIHFLYGQMQRGPISKTDLLALRTAQRSLLSSINTEYIVTFDKENRPAQFAGAPPRTFRTHFAMDGVHLYLQRETLVDGTSTGVETLGYDGEVVRRLLAEDNQLPFGSVSRFQGRRQFIVPGNPLLAAKLLDYRSDLDEETASDDLTQILTGHYVFEDVHTIRNQRCVLIGDAFEQAYLAIDLGYALVQYRAGNLAFDPSAGTYSRTDSYDLLDNDDFEQVADNLWLPKRFTFTSLSNGEPYYAYATQVSTYSVNTPPSRTLFEQIIPDGTFVSDGVQNATYQVGTRSDESGPVSAGEPRHKTGIGPWILAFVNVVMFGIIGAIYVRWRMGRRKG